MLNKIYADGKEYQAQGDGKEFSEFVRSFVKPDSLINFDEIVKAWNKKQHHASQYISNKRPDKIDDRKRILTELSKHRFKICKTCDKSKDNGFKCDLHKGCCFGRWRSQPASQCPASPPKWPAIKDNETPLHQP